MIAEILGGETAFVWAIRGNHIKIVQLLIDNNVNVNYAHKVS